VNSYFLAGALVGSGLFILLGREPARVMLAKVRRQLRK
jgi:hypothetical protein